MRDARKEIVQALITKIGEKTTRQVLTIVPKAGDNSGTMPPDEYIYISDIYQDDNSTKTGFIYSYDVLVQVVHNNLTSKVDFYADINAVVSIIESRRDLTLSNDFECMEIGLLSNSEEEISTDTGRKNIGVVRFKIDVEDKG